MSMKRTRTTRISALLFVVMLVFLLLPFTAYAAQSTATISIPVHKEISGDTPETAETFTFRLAAVDGAPMPAGSVNGVKTVTLQGSGNTTFGEITYTELGDYQYTITEVQGSNTSYSYDTATYTATVQVAWKNEIDGEKQAVLYLVKEGVDGKQENALFTNTYSEPQSVVVNPPIRKIVSGLPSTAGTFTFRFIAGDATYPMPEGSTGGVKIVTITGAGTVEIGAIVYTQPGVYTYTVSEVNGGLNGYTYDTTVYTMTVTVKKVGNRLQAVRTIKRMDGTSASALSFTNRYSKTDDPTQPTTPPGKPDGPKTGDETNDAIWWTLLGLSILGMVFALVYRGKRQTDK